MNSLISRKSFALYASLLSLIAPLGAQADSFADMKKSLNDSIQAVCESINGEHCCPARSIA